VSAAGGDKRHFGAAAGTSRETWTEGAGADPASDGAVFAASAPRRPVTALVRLSIRNGGKRALSFQLGHAHASHFRQWRNTLSTLMTLTESASELGKEARESIDELGRSAGRSLDKARDETGDALHEAASSVRKTGRRGSEAIEQLATGTADRLDATASYVEDHDLSQAYAGLRRFGRRHLTGAMVATAGIGFLAGLALCRVTHPLRKCV
jgi:ElaB/YqjD/DUF883 family membrane-anchored ribosome-binding protein